MHFPGKPFYSVEQRLIFNKILINFLTKGSAKALISRLCMIAYKRKSC
ncbi:hypothetical protein NOC27_1146 [Nitrosococcus oceani AFC27]|nr:hypothetical protein NOC27_1146 [Nitrosococcus oceani AFC27]